MVPRNQWMWIAVSAGVLWSAGADAQTVGTFAWQTQPYCNVVSVTVTQQGGVYQLTGTDNLCGAGVAPVTGTAAPSGAGVVFGLTVSPAGGRPVHLTASIALATLSGTWWDGDGGTGTFVFGGNLTAAPRPAPAAPAAQVIALGLLSTTGPALLDARARAGVTVTATRPGAGFIDLTVDGADTDLFPILMLTPQLNGAMRTCQTRGLIVTSARQITYRIACYDSSGALVDTSFQYLVTD